MAHKLLGICGALRKGSTNRLLMAEARRLAQPEAWEEGDLRLPLYDGDLEKDEGIPEGVQRLHAQIAAADGVIICTPEYNKSVPGVLKNALDWVSRVKGSPWLDKPVAIMSAAGGRAGGDRSQFALRLCLTPFRPRLITGPEVMIASSSQAFGEDGRLLDPKSEAVLVELLGVLDREIGRG